MREGGTDELIELRDERVNEKAVVCQHPEHSL